MINGFLNNNTFLHFLPSLQYRSWSTEKNIDEGNTPYQLALVCSSYISGYRLVIVHVERTWNLRIVSIRLILDQRQKALTKVIYFQVRQSLTKPDHIFSGKTILTKPRWDPKIWVSQISGLVLVHKITQEMIYVC
jgi:hypothetical protein